mmetsp:Transcript_25625/g.40153  ORF Transcript_25625/g.40153 Transcript_25625/m.40153 type:complete len:178 (+) Transcript_25625:1530-2063(+)|eukprot:CAMPEP_0184329202 /NCGR_PEP_ID=MMETSP1049-20130417/144024_1 /TAXON_ID=77928 /ORGANISM="Proteomonas sulcata, Strain CCMP704" /LENGTH=177 /DNA_ID=CAMNT_0026651553 /DNA_START=1931 /DNA_END=2464 /DNA_ORIENTATION=-
MKARKPTFDPGDYLEALENRLKGKTKAPRKEGMPGTQPVVTAQATSASIINIVHGVPVSSALGPEKTAVKSGKGFDAYVLATSHDGDSVNDSAQRAVEATTGGGEGDGVGGQSAEAIQSVPMDIPSSKPSQDDAGRSQEGQPGIPTNPSSDLTSASGAPHSSSATLPSEKSACSLLY